MLKKIFAWPQGNALTGKDHKGAPQTMDDLEAEESVWMPKLYMVTRSDLPPGVQACQAIHSAREFAAKYPAIESQWYKNSNHVCMLAVANEKQLTHLMFKALEQGIKSTGFSEPDLDNQLTAACFEPTEQSREFLKDIPLALRQNWFGKIKK